MDGQKTLQLGESCLFYLFYKWVNQNPEKTKQKFTLINMKPLIVLLEFDKLSHFFLSLVSLTFPGIPSPYQMFLSVVVLHDQWDVLQEEMKSNSCVVLLLILSYQECWFSSKKQCRLGYFFLILCCTFFVLKHFFEAALLIENGECWEWSMRIIVYKSVVCITASFAYCSKPLIFIIRQKSLKNIQKTVWNKLFHKQQN